MIEMCVAEEYVRHGDFGMNREPVMIFHAML